AHAYIPRSIFIKHLEPADKLLRRASLAEAAGAVEDLEERIKVDCFGHTRRSVLEGLVPGVRYACGEEKGSDQVHTLILDASNQLVHLGVCGILPARPQQISQSRGWHAAVAALVEQGKGFLVVCGLRGSDNVSTGDGLERRLQLEGRRGPVRSLGGRRHVARCWVGKCAVVDVVVGMGGEG